MSIARMHIQAESFFNEHGRLDLLADYMDVVDKSVRIGQLEGKDDVEIFDNIDNVIESRINHLFYRI